MTFWLAAPRLRIPREVCALANVGAAKTVAAAARTNTNLRIGPLLRLSPHKIIIQQTWQPQRQKRYCIIKFQSSCLAGANLSGSGGPLSFRAKFRKVDVTLDFDVRRLAPRTIADTRSTWARSRGLLIEMRYGEDAGLRLVGIGAVLARWESGCADAIGADVPFKACSAR